MGETPHSPVALYEAAHLLGTLIAKTILASVHVRARKKAGHMGASDLIKALQNLARRGPFSNRSSPVRIPVYIARPGHGSLRGQRGLPQHLVRSGGQALQGPQRAYVDTRPPARRAIACTLALGRCVLEYLTRLMRYAAMTGSAQRNGSPDRQTLCRMTDSLRAKATRAF